MDLLKGIKNIHFVGIGGVGMSALARVLLHWGYSVSGTDIKENKWTNSLSSHGARIKIGHDVTSIEGAELVVYSSAIQSTNPEIKKALELGLTLIHRAELLAEIVRQGILIAVSGTHGKTTTTSIVSHVMTASGRNPTCIVGGRMANGGDNVVLGSRELFVAEIDESDRSQSHFSPDYLILTNLEAEHLDIYRDLRDLEMAFRMYVERLKQGGKVIYSADCPNLCSLMSHFPGKGISYSLKGSADYVARNVRLAPDRSSYSVYRGSQRVARIELGMPGLHNVMNSLAAVALADQFGLDLEVIRKRLAEFKGVGRRLEIKMNSEDIMVVDDYAHHPTEVEASLAALRLFARPITVVFQPHRFSRTKHLAEAFGQSFRAAHRVIITEIYGAGEKPHDGVSANLIYETVSQDGHSDVRFVPKDEILDFLKANVSRGELVAFLGAGNISEVANEYVDKYRTFAQV